MIQGAVQAVREDEMYKALGYSLRVIPNIIVSIITV